MTTSGLLVLAAVAAAAGAVAWTRSPVAWVQVSRRAESAGAAAAHEAPSDREGLRARFRSLRLGRARSPDVTGLLGALAAELDAGQALGVALQEACRGLDPTPCPRGLAAVEVGGDVAAALRADADASGSAGLRALAMCWQVAGRSGSGLSASIGRLAQAQRASDRARGELVAEMATVRASARLLAGLPVVGLLFGIALGAEPLAWLGGTWAGRAALLGGLTLQAVGLLWMHRIVAQAKGRIP